MMNLASALQRAGCAYKIFLNDHDPARRLLEHNCMPYSLVELTDVGSDWEGQLIAQERIHLWINDRLDTMGAHAAHVKRRGIPLVTFDDRGSGAAYADLNIAALAFDSGESLSGRRVLRGVEYLILNPGIADYRHQRQAVKRLLVTLGGSDTYGVTVKVVRALRHLGRAATVIVGPGFAHHTELAAAAGANFEIKCGLPSLVAEFEHHDLAVTGGGITPFEANASGLPCIVIANEHFEIPVGRELQRLGGSVFAGHHSDWNESLLEQDLPIAAMSQAGMTNIGLDGTDRVVRELLAL